MNKWHLDKFLAIALPPLAFAAGQHPAVGRIQPCPSKDGIFLLPNPHDDGKGTCCHVAAGSADCAHAIMPFNSQ